MTSTTLLLDNPPSISAAEFHEILLTAHASGNVARLRFIDALRALHESRLYMQLGFPDVAKFYMMASHHRAAGAFEVVFNKVKHDALPAEIKSILRHAALSASTTQLGMAYVRYPKDLGEIGRRGVSVIRTGETVLRAQLAAWDKVIAENSKEPFFARVIASQKAWVKGVQPYLAVNNLSSGELAAAYKHFFG